MYEIQVIEHPITRPCSTLEHAQYVRIHCTYYLRSYNYNTERMQAGRKLIGKTIMQLYMSNM
jgi:hypothetical protein